MLYYGLFFSLIATTWSRDIPHPEHQLLARDVPNPLNFAPNQRWEGDDGSWSTFDLRVGTPNQIVRVLISTAGQETWAVVPTGCTGSAKSPTCAADRGNLFKTNESSTWQARGTNLINIEANLNFSAFGQYGLDTVGFGDSPPDGPSLTNQVVAGIGTVKQYLGVFGIGPKPTNFTNFTDPQPSFFSTLKDQGKIPSLSWSYTAGASYRGTKVPGSLVFGGYDLARFTPSNLSIPFAADTSRDLVIGLQSITTNYSGEVTLLSSGVLTFIDSTASQIWLPQTACDEFERLLGLTWDPSNEIYLVNDSQHKYLQAINPSFKFQLGTTVSGGETIDIILPYSAFDLTASPPFASNTTKYFPIKRAASDAQYTLGRTFLQEAYLIADYERANFSISQCDFGQGKAQNLVTIPSINATSTPSPTGKKALSTGGIVGIVVGIIVICLALSAVSWTLWRRNKASSYSPQPSSTATNSGEDELLDGQAVSEAHGQSPAREVDGHDARAEVAGQAVSELPHREMHMLAGSEMEYAELPGAPVKGPDIEIREGQASPSAT